MNQLQNSQKTERKSEIRVKATNRGKHVALRKPARNRETEVLMNLRDSDKDINWGEVTDDNDDAEVILQRYSVQEVGSQIQQFVCRLRDNKYQ
jgi:hypothetical protein